MSTERATNAAPANYGRSMVYVSSPPREQPSARTIPSAYDQPNFAPGHSGYHASGYVNAKGENAVPAEDIANEEEDSEEDDGEEEVETYITTHGKGKENRHDSAQLSPTQLLPGMQSMSLRPCDASPPSQPPHVDRLYNQRTFQDSKFKYAISVEQQTPQAHITNRGGTQSLTQSSAQQSNRLTVASLTPDVQKQIGYLERRVIKTDPGTDDREFLDKRYKRVAKSHHPYFFVTGRVFKMLWTEPAGLANLGKTRNSTHFSTVWLGEQAFSEIRHFVVVRNKGIFSQCIPIQTYKGNGAAKAGLVMIDHGIIHTTPNPSDQLPGEHLTKYSIRVESTAGEQLHKASRINYGKAYAVEHNVKVLDIGMVTEKHRYLLAVYFDAAMTGR